MSIVPRDDSSRTTDRSGAWTRNSGASGLRRSGLRSCRDAPARRTGIAIRVAATGRNDFARIGFVRHILRLNSSTALNNTNRFMKAIYYTAATLDGFIATRDDSLEWLFPLGELEATSYPAFIR